MGGKNSIPIEAVDGFTPDEVARLHKRFRKLDKDSSESLCVEEFLALPELKENPLVQRVVQVRRGSFQQNQSGNSLSGAKKVCDKIWPKLQLKVLFMAKFALNKSC